MYIGMARERERVCEENADGNERKSVLSPSADRIPIRPFKYFNQMILTRCPISRGPYRAMNVFRFNLPSRSDSDKTASKALITCNVC